MPEPRCRYVSRAGLKLEAALRTFGLNVTGWTCADFGSHVGGFVDCLLQHGAARVYAIDPGYGVLDYRLRRDPCVVVCERTNALRYACPEPCDLVTIDAGWTPQRLILPAARRCLKSAKLELCAPPPAAGRVLALIKPQYEAPPDVLVGGVVPADRLAGVLDRCRSDVGELGWRILGEIESPLRGHGGNVEYVWLLCP